MSKDRAPERRQGGSVQRCLWVVVGQLIRRVAVIMRGKDSGGSSTRNGVVNGVVKVGEREWSWRRVGSLSWRRYHKPSGRGGCEGACSRAACAGGSQRDENKDRRG